MNSLCIRSWMCALGLTLGCGSVAGSGGHDAGSGARDAVPVCDPDGAFEPPVLMQGFGTSVSEAAAHLSPDELTMYFAATYAGGLGAFDLYTANRSRIDDPFGVPASLTALNSAAPDADPSVSADGLTVVFYSKRNADEGNRIYIATRSSPLAPFGAPAPLAGVAAPTATNSDLTAFLTADGQELWFASDRAGNLDIWRAPRAGAGFTNPEAVAVLNTADVEIIPVLSADRLTVYVATSRGAATQNQDIWLAHRATVTSEFSAPHPAVGVNTAGNDHPSWLSPDNCRLYLTSNVAASDDLYVATRRPR